MKGRGGGSIKLRLFPSLNHKLMTHGFKEWALVCDALGHGTQSIILRKGGIAEDRDGFRFAQADFLLFPTLFHEQLQKLKLPATTPLPVERLDGQIEIQYRAEVGWTREITSTAQLAALAPYHLWRDELTDERFHYDERDSLSLAWVRVFRLSAPFVFPNAKSYGGCRSWVTLPDLPVDTTSTPVLDEETNRAREREILALLSAPVAAGAP
jgi:hypothetical protein